MKTMKRFLVLAAALLAGAAFLLAYADKVQNLPLRFRQWLDEEAVYLIGPKEKEVFLGLTTDRERDLFIEAFWKQRDPTPGTDRNEFREEHYQRIAYANMHFGRSGIKPGWKTDRGRIYIILGPPKQDIVYDEKSEVVPVEVWYYQGFSKYGLPDGFSCLFYKPDPSADYELYSPVSDGPAKLLRSSNFDPADVQAAYSRLLDIEPEVAQVSLSLISGEEGTTQSSSLASQILLDSIRLLPLKMIDEQYAVRFLKYKDVVEVEYSVNAIDNRATVMVIPDRSGMSFVHYAIEPERLTVEAVAGRFTTTIEVNGQVKDKEGRVIFQFDRKTPVSLSADQAEKLGSRPVSFQGLFPLADGTYDLTLILKNHSSKEFTTVEESIVVPAQSAVLQGGPGLPTGLSAGPLVIGYGAKSEQGNTREMRAFFLDGIQMYVSPLVLFIPGDTLNAALELLGAPSDMAQAGLQSRGIGGAALQSSLLGGARSVRFDALGPDGRVAATKTVPLVEPAQPGAVATAFVLSGLPFGDYRLEAKVLDNAGQALLTRSATFGITSVVRVPRPLVFSDPLPNSADPIHAYLVGGQHYNQGRLDLAESLAGRAYKSDPSSQKFALGYARVLLTRGKFAETREVLRPFAAGAQPEAATLEFTAEASRALGDYPRAADAYRAYLERFGAKISALNGLGECYAKMGDTARALATWEKSLELKPDQDDIRKEVAALRK